MVVLELPDRVAAAAAVVILAVACGTDVDVSGVDEEGRKFYTPDPRLSGARCS